MTKIFSRKGLIILAGLIFCAALLSTSVMAKKKKDYHPFDLFTEDIHEMHNSFFEAASDRIQCETCHTSDDSYARGARKVNRLGCHFCHNPKMGPEPTKDAPMEGPTDCKLCHIDGWYPKPQSHKADWKSKHQNYAKKNPQECQTCHSNQMFCMDCHKRRDTVQERMHRRNFRFFHSIEARANPRRCDACHTVSFCQQCHAGRGTSKR